MKLFIILLALILIPKLTIAQSKGHRFFFSNTKKENVTTSSTTSNRVPALAKSNPQTVVAHNHSNHTHHHKKDTVTLSGNHHKVSHSSMVTSNAVASSSRDHVAEVFNKGYSSLIKGVVYKKGTTEILNNTKIVLETEEAKIDSSITALSGMYTLRVQNRTTRHLMYVYKRGFKPLLIEVPDSLLDRHQITVVKIQLEPDGSNYQEERVTIVLKGRVVNANTGMPIPGASVALQDNVNKTSQQLNCDASGHYYVELKKYAHYTVSASKGNCTSDKINKSTLSIKQSIAMDLDLKINCP